MKGVGGVGYEVASPLVALSTSDGVVVGAIEACQWSGARALNDDTYNSAVTGCAGTWLALKGQVTGPPG